MAATASEMSGPEIEELQPRTHGTGLQLRDLQHAIDEHFQLLTGFVDRLQKLVTFCRVQALFGPQKRFGIPFDGGKWGA